MTPRCIAASNLTSEAASCRCPPGSRLKRPFCRHVVSVSEVSTFTSTSPGALSRSCPALPANVVPPVSQLFTLDQTQPETFAHRSDYSA